ncbi:hypothetical protein MMC07_007621 [Pseudocyphellaria aurata]|nr:hypothetical protein [Pseudocyphellaria aurata]
MSDYVSKVESKGMPNDTSEIVVEPDEEGRRSVVKDVVPHDYDSKEPDTTELPVDHPITMLSEAMAYYSSDMPPFLFLDRKKNPAGSRLLVLLATNGKLKRPATGVNLLAREWGNRGLYWTADLNGERIILKSFRGGPRGGSNYRRWLGPLEGFQDYPIAFAVPNAKANGKATFDKQQQYRESTDDGLTHYGQRKRRTSARGAETKFGRLATDEALNSEISSLSPPPKEPVYFPGLESSARNGLTKLYVSEPENLSSSERRRRKSKVPSKVLRLNVSGAVTALPCLSQSNQERSEKGSKDFQSLLKTDNGIASNKRSYSKSTKGKTPFDLSTLTRIASKRRKHNFGPVNGTDNPFDRHADNPLSRQVETPAVPDIDRPTKCQSSPIASATSTISPYKQANTNLCFFLPPGDEYVPLKLRSCMTMSTFFGAAIEAFDLHDQAEKVRALRITFNYVSEGDQKNTWLVKKTIPDSFEIFLDVVDRLPVWDEGGTCGVRVDIILWT